MKNTKLLLTYRLILVLGILFAMYLIINDIRMPGYCPSLWIVPACYPVLVYFLVPLMCSFVQIPHKNIIAYIFTGAGLITAVFFSLRAISGVGYCPVVFNIPMCFAALLTFTVLLILLSVTVNGKDI